MLSKRNSGSCLGCVLVVFCLSWLVTSGPTFAGRLDEEDHAAPPPEELKPPPGAADGRRGGLLGEPSRMRGRGGRFGPPGLRMWRRLSEEERNSIIDFMVENFPERFDELAEIEAEDEQLFGRYIGRVLPEMVRLRDLKEDDPEVFEVQIQTMKKEFTLRRLARRYRFASDANKKVELERDIRRLVGELFDLRGQRETLELARLEKRLTHLRERIEQRGVDRDEHIDRLVADILNGKSPRNPKGLRGSESDRPRFNAVPEAGGPEKDKQRRDRRPKRRTHKSRDRNDH